MKQKIRLIFKWIFKLTIALAVFFSVVSIPFLIAFEAWTPLKFISGFVALAVYIQIHKAVIKKKSFEWYRWLINSLIYRYHVYSLKRKLKELNFVQKVEYHTKRILQKEYSAKWFDKYWFGRGLDKVMTNEMIKSHNLENENDGNNEVSEYIVNRVFAK